MSQGGVLVLVHDGSFAGFLCAAAELAELAPSGADPRQLSVRGPGGPAGLFEERRSVATERARAARLWSRLGERCGDEVRRGLLEAFCSDLPEAQAATARMIATLLERGSAALDELGLKDALTVEKAANRARREAHLMTGLLRFRELRDGSLLASIDPDCAVLPLIAGHFAARFPAFRFAIRDERRDAALVHEPGGPWSIGARLAIEAETEAGPPLAGDEAAIEACWLRYFGSVAIGERRNPRLQASHMPRKHWKNLPEKRGETG